MKDEAQVIKEAEDALSLMNYKKSNSSIIKKEYQDMMNVIKEEYENKSIYIAVSHCEELLDDVENASFEEKTIVSNFVSNIMTNIETLIETMDVYPSMMPYFTPNQMLEIGVFDTDPNGNGYKVESSMKNTDWFNSYLTTGNPGNDWYNMVSEAYLECYRNPSNENKQNLLELGWNPEVELNIANITSRRPFIIENMKNNYIATVVDLTELYISEYDIDNICESYIVSKGDINLNFNSWASGSKNILYITGLSGSGKSTLSKTLAKEYNAKVIEFDKFTVGLVKGKDALDKRNTNSFILEYISDHSLPKLSWDDQDTPKFNDEHKKFLAWLENKLSESENVSKKFILEGIQIFNNIDANHFKSKPLIIVGTSVLESWMRRNKRTFSNCTSTKDKLINFIFNLKMFPSFAEYEKSLQNFRNTVNESAINDREKMISIIEKGLEEIGVKCGISKSDRDWGSDVFLKGESRSLFVCIEKDKDKQKEILSINKKLSGLGGRMHLDNYNSIFLRAKKMKPINESIIQEGLKSENDMIKELNETIKSKINKSYKDYFISITNLSSGGFISKEETEVKLFGFNTLPLEPSSIYDPANKNKYKVLYSIKLNFLFTKDKLDKDLREYASSRKYKSLFKSNIKESSIHEDSKIDTAYFLSANNMDGKTLQPRIPSNYLTNNGYEDNTTKRICFSITIGGALKGLSQNLKGKDFYVHIPSNNNYDIYRPSTKEVPDCNITDEIWIKDSVKLKCIGKIHVTESPASDKGQQYTYGDKTATIYKWNWEWTEHYITEGVEEDHFVASKYIRDILFEEVGRDNRSTDFTPRDIESDDGGYTIADCKVIDKLTQTVLDVTQGRVDNSICNKYYLKSKSAGESGWIIYVYPKNEKDESLKDLQDKVFNNFDWYKK